MNLKHGVQVTIQSKDGQDVILSWEKGRCFERDTSNSLLQALKKQQVATYVYIILLYITIV